MARNQKKITHYRQVAAKAADWIEKQQREDGAIDPSGGMASVYKTTFALVTTGRLHAAWRLMDYIAKNYMTEPGEFHADNDNECDNWMAYYRNCYVLIAALRLGRFDIASPTAIKHFLRYQHQNGGFCSSLNRSKRRQINALFTCMGGWICLYTAQWRRAVAAGDFIIRLIKNQPAMFRRFYVETDARTGQCVVDFEPGTGIAHFVDPKQDCQHFFYSGAMMGFLADLHRATGKKQYLDGALQMFKFEHRVNPRSFSWPSKCKVGWGAALLYSITHNPEHRLMAEKVADITFSQPQNPNGSWPAMNFPLRDDGSGFVISSLEMTAEFTFELAELVKALA